MRTIKFRVWDKFRKKMINQENILSIHFDRRTGNPNLVSFTNNKNYHTGLEEADRGYANEIVFMQWTGLKDKNGEEVYEGDIVKSGLLVDDNDGALYRLSYSKHLISKVIFENGMFWFQNIKNENRQECFIEELISPEVIGNIFENRELLVTFQKGFDKQYSIVVSLIKKYGERFPKKHGEHIVLQGRDSFLALDTWNGYINLIDGAFDDERDTFDKGEQLARNTRGMGVETSRACIGKAYQFILSETNQ